MIKAVLHLLRPAPHLPEIRDAALIEQTYKYWRTRIFYSMYVGYLFYYFTRKSFTFITPFLSADLDLTKGDIGFLASTLSISYGISRFTSGIMCDRSNPRYFMAFGLIITGFCNILFGFSSSVLVFALLWGLNGWFQGWGWPACTKQLTHWFGRTERGTCYSACSTSHTVGGFLIAFLAAYSANWFGWRYGMFIPGVLCVITGCWLLNRLRDVPQSLGLPPIEKFKNEKLHPKDEKAHDHEEILPIRKILFEQVLNNRYVWVLAISYFFVYVVRTAVNDWGTLYLTETKGYTPVSAAACVSWFEVGGFFGILVAGWGSDNWFSGKRVPLMVLSSLLLIFAVIGFWHLPAGQVVLTAFFIASIGFLVFGPQMLVGLAAAEFVSKKAASTSNGFAGCFGYLGAAVAGYPLGKVVDIWGWDWLIITLVICSVACVFFLLPIWSIKIGTPKEEGHFVVADEEILVIEDEEEDRNESSLVPETSMVN